MSYQTQTRLLIILGATATGKTAAALHLADALESDPAGGFRSVEIVNADSRQLYRGMDIGTAKPTFEEQRRAPHHLFDIIAPAERITLAEYQRRAYAVIDSVAVRGALPVMVGGTGQYITATIEGWSIPEVPPDPDLRAELRAFADEAGKDALHERLRELDPPSADRIDYRNVRRVIRALEVCIKTGEPFSKLRTKKPPDYDILQIGLRMDRDALYARADVRVDRMIAAGLEDEVRALRESGVDWRQSAMSAVGYRQWQPYFEGTASRDEVIEEIKNQTHSFIRRQETWFRGHDGGAIRWIDVEPGHFESTARAVEKRVRAWLTSAE